MNMRINLGTLVTITALSCVACSSPTGDPDIPPVGAMMTATVNGASFRPPRASATLTGAGNFVIAATMRGTDATITLRLFSIGKPGTYPLGVTPALIGGAGEVAVGGAVFSTPTTGTAGTVTIASVSPTRIVGTFSFVATRTVNFTEADAQTVTGGEFDVAVTGSGTLDIPANVGSSVTGTVRDTAFLATAVTVADGPANGKLRLDLRQSSRRLTLDVPALSGVGTYALGTGTGRSMQLDAPVGTFPSTWGGSEATSVGIVTVTSVTAARVQGTISATLTPTFAPLGTPPAIVSITFDIGLP